MTAATIAILGVLCCLSVVFLRSGHADYAVSVLPVLFVPAAYLVAVTFSGLILVGWETPTARSVILLAGLALSLVGMGLFSLRIRVKKNRRLYLALTLIYCILLAVIYLTHII